MTAFRTQEFILKCNKGISCQIRQMKEWEVILHMNDISTWFSHRFGQMSLNHEFTTNRPLYNTVSVYVMEDLNLKSSYHPKGIIESQAFSTADSWAPFWGVIQYPEGKLWFRLQSLEGCILGGNMGDPATPNWAKIVLWNFISNSAKWRDWPWRILPKFHFCPSSCGLWVSYSPKA